MMLEENLYTGKNINDKIPFIESCLRFFDEHYQWLAKQRGNKALDGNGKLVLYPGSGAETFKMAYNSTSTITALQSITQRLLTLPETFLSPEQKGYCAALQNRIPSINYGNFNGHTTISPAKIWERINNTESPQLYPVYPWGIFGIGMDINMRRRFEYIGPYFCSCLHPIMFSFNSNKSFLQMQFLFKGLSIEGIGK